MQQLVAVKTQTQLRPLQPKDNQAVAFIVRTVLPTLGMSGEGCAASDPELDDMFATYSKPRSAYFVIESDGEIVGCGGIASLIGGEEDICELQKMYVVESARGNGYGEMLIHQCLKTAKELGFNRCYLETFKTMVAAQKLYHKYGFSSLNAPLGSTGHYQCTHWFIKEL